MKVQITAIVYLQLEHSHTSGMIVSIPIHTYNDTIAGIAHTKPYPSHNILASNIHKIDACMIRCFFLLDFEILGVVVREKGVSDCCSKQSPRSMCQSQYIDMVYLPSTYKIASHLIVL